MVADFHAFLNKQLKNSEFKKEYDSNQPNRALIQTMIDTSHDEGVTQKELSERTVIAQGDISKLEYGKANPSIHTLQRLAGHDRKD
jgi:DNA-binding Xre family transcriptional regulator